MDSEKPEGTGGGLRSMTGFGRSRRVFSDVEVVAEIRSVNHRYLDVSLKMPKIYTAFEPEIRRKVAQTVQRGKVDVLVSRTGGAASVMDLALDEDLARDYFECLHHMKRRFQLAGDVTVADMLTLDDVVRKTEREGAVDQEWPEVSGAVDDALAALDAMRSTEGVTLWRDIIGRLADIGRQVDEITPLTESVVRAAKERLERRLQELTGGLAFDENRLIQEVALIADRSDVTEELTRMRSHVDQFLAFGRQGSPLGRKLDFLLQELNREANTVGSKCNSSDIASRVVQVKAELEKIREQVQNIE